MKSSSTLDKKATSPETVRKIFAAYLEDELLPFMMRKNVLDKLPSFMLKIDGVETVCQFEFVHRQRAELFLWDMQVGKYDYSLLLTDNTLSSKAAWPASVKPKPLYASESLPAGQYGHVLSRIVLATKEQIIAELASLAQSKAPSILTDQEVKDLEAYQFPDKDKFPEEDKQLNYRKILQQRLSYLESPTAELGRVIVTSSDNLSDPIKFPQSLRDELKKSEKNPRIADLGKMGTLLDLQKILTTMFGCTFPSKGKKRSSERDSNKRSKKPSSPSATSGPSTPVPVAHKSPSTGKINKQLGQFHIKEEKPEEKPVVVEIASPTSTIQPSLQSSPGTATPSPASPSFFLSPSSAVLGSPWGSGPEATTPGRKFSKTSVGT